jgi:predicted homoserine dehydrogenase-like protein/glycosyltransferase involved in cell wall biosynthesis
MPRANRKKIYKIGVIGTGGIARGLIHLLNQQSEFNVVSVVTRRKIGTITDVAVPKKILTNNVKDAISRSELIIECTGDVIYGTESIEKIFAAGLPVVTMSAELQLVTGSALAKKGRLIEAEGDQPGVLANLDREVKLMGFEPIVYGNIKGYLNTNPARKDMEFWGKKQQMSLPSVTSFTDGTKVQIEQALVANGLGATIAQRNLTGLKCTDLEDGAKKLAKLAEKIGLPISDYLLYPGGPAGVFIVAKHKKEQKNYLKYLKLGKGPFYIISRPYHLCHLEIPKTLINVLTDTGQYNFNNGPNPSVQVVAVAKRNLIKGEVIKRGLGNFETRGEAVKITDCPKGVPIGLLQNARLKCNLKEGATVTFDDVWLPQSRALAMWGEILAKTIKPARANAIIPHGKFTLPPVKRPTVSICIPAYNEEKNIGQLIESIKRQRSESFLLGQIIVAGDGCTDRTASIVNKYAATDCTIKLIDDDKRLGKAERLNRLFRYIDSDIAVLLDADVTLGNESVIANLIAKFDYGVGMVAGNDQPHSAESLIERVVTTSTELWKIVRSSINEGDTVHNSHGCILALSKPCYRQLQLPRQIIGTDQWLYFATKKNNLEFRYAPEAVILYREPRTLTEYLTQHARFLLVQGLMVRFFGQGIKDEYKIPLIVKIRALVIMMFRRPLTLPFAIGLQIVIRLSKKHYRKDFGNGIWTMINTSKS